MPEFMGISAAAAGAAGSPYRKIVTRLTPAAGTYVINETNFPGIGAFLPGFALVEMDATGAGVSATLAASHDNGTTWVTLATVTAGTTGLFLFLDTATTFRIVTVLVAPAIRFFLM